MAKKQKVIPHFEEDDFDLFGDCGHIHDDPMDEMIGDMMHSFIEASNHQLDTAVALTRLVIEKSGAATMSEKDIFALYNRALQNISDHSLVKELLEKFNE